MDDTGVVVEEYTTGLVADDQEEAAPSSVASSPPADKHALLSSDAPDEGNDTPPSSPPARLPSPVPRARKPAFSFLKRKRAVAATVDSSPASASGPLGDITNSVREGPRSVKKPRLMQMQIDLGGEMRTACRSCGMEYIPSNAQDAALHKEFHTANLGGVDVGKAFLKSHASGIVWESAKDGAHQEGRAHGLVIVIDRKSSLAEKNKARRILKVVNLELSAAKIEDKRLWSQEILPVNGAMKHCQDETLPLAGEERKSCCDRFKVYLFVSEGRCIGLCLAENISMAYEVSDQNSNADGNMPKPAMSNSSSVSISGKTIPAILGISRIWTSASHRRKGVARALLNAARESFIYGVQIPKDMVAFSQPTESGGRLARTWFGDTQKWHVYIET